MDEAVETVITGTKYQNIQTIIAIIFSGLNSLFFYLIPFLFKQPILFNNNKSTSIKNNTNSTSINNYTLDEICSSNNINSFIDYDNSFNNYSLILKLFCNNNIFEFEIIIFIYYISKGINSILLGYFTDKFGRFFILFYGSVLTIVSFIFLFLGINNYFFLF
jgi:MFS family permease